MAYMTPIRSAALFGAAAMHDPMREYRQEVAHFLVGFRWTHVAHLGCEKPMTSHRLWVEFRYRFIRRLEQSAQNRLQWYCVEEADSSGRLHLHALLGGTAQLRIKDLDRSWKCGFGRFTIYPLRFSSRFSAVCYMLKEVDENALHDVSATLPELAFGENPMNAA